MKVLILGMDGYIGWALAQHQLSIGNQVCGIDNFSRRRNVTEMGSDSAFPLPPMENRIINLKKVYGDKIEFYIGDLANASFIDAVIKKFNPDGIVHLAEQPSAPFSMIDQKHAVDTHVNNVIGTLNLIYAIKNYSPNAHLIKLGTMGEYGYDTELDIPEGFFDIEYRGKKATMPFPRNAGSWYHCTKVHDSNNTMFACKLWGLKSTDIMQGVVYGTRLTNISKESYQNTRFDFDEAFGTVINRFCAEAVIDYPLTVYGQGMQTRGFLALEDSVQCISLLLNKPPENENYRVVNQFDEQYNVTELAEKVKTVGDKMGLNVEIKSIENPRKEKESHHYNADHQKLKDLGFKPTRQIDEEIAMMLEDLVPHKTRISMFNDSIVKKIRWQSKLLEKQLIEVVQ